MPKPRKKKRPHKRLLAVPDLAQSKAAVLNTLTSKSGRRSYVRAITDFVDWYCSDPRLAFNRTVILRLPNACPNGVRSNISVGCWPGWKVTRI
jgi:hypothetical protein